MEGSTPSPATTAMGYVLLEFRCRHCGARIESLEDRAQPAQTIAHAGCGGLADRTISAVRSLTVWGSVSRGAREEPPSPGCLDTRPLADGMPLREWRAKQRAYRRDQRRAWVKSQA
jgi:hypothetical protein